MKVLDSPVLVCLSCAVLFAWVFVLVGGQPSGDIRVVLGVGGRYIGDSRQIARIDSEVGLVV